MPPKKKARTEELPKKRKAVPDKEGKHDRCNPAGHERGYCFVGTTPIPQKIRDIRDAVLLCVDGPNGFPDRDKLFLVGGEGLWFRVDGIIKDTGGAEELSRFAGDLRLFSGHLWAKLLTRSSFWKYHWANPQPEAWPECDREPFTLMVARKDPPAGTVTECHGDVEVANRLRGPVYRPTVAQTPPANLDTEPQQAEEQSDQVTPEVSS
ncbi:hypothetical protein LTR17_001081 [Elasticomyces elasticus]|nr:hypothetical protein LTR17_001081 [Elasticomyces elasticus]